MCSLDERGQMQLVPRASAGGRATESCTNEVTLVSERSGKRSGVGTETKIILAIHTLASTIPLTE
jgi:hypothetical protein